MIVMPMEAVATEVVDMAAEAAAATVVVLPEAMVAVAMEEVAVTVAMEEGEVHPVAMVEVVGAWETISAPTWVGSTLPRRNWFPLKRTFTLNTLTFRPAVNRMPTPGEPVNTLVYRDKMFPNQS